MIDRGAPLPLAPFPGEVALDEDTEGWTTGDGAEEKAGLACSNDDGAGRTEVSSVKLTGSCFIGEEAVISDSL